MEKKDTCRCSSPHPRTPLTKVSLLTLKEVQTKILHLHCKYCVSEVRLAPQNSYLCLLSISGKCISIQKVSEGNGKSVTPVVLSTSVGPCTQPYPLTARAPLFQDTKCKIKINFFPSFQNML